MSSYGRVRRWELDTNDRLSSTKYLYAVRILRRERCSIIFRGSPSHQPITVYEHTRPSWKRDEIQRTVYSHVYDAGRI